MLLIRMTSCTNISLLSKKITHTKYKCLCINTTYVFYHPFLRVGLSLIKMFIVTMQDNLHKYIYIYMATIEMRMRSVRILEMFQHKTRIYYIFNNALHIYIKKYILHKDIDI